MGAGGNVLGFGGGFARGFANAMLRNQDLAREETEKQRQRDLQEFNITFPLIFQQAQETGDYTNANAAFFRMFPEAEKRFKKDGGSPFEQLAPLLQPAIGDARRLDVSKDQADAISAGDPSKAVLPSRTLVSPATPPPPPDPKSLFLGQPMQTPEQKATRAAGIKAAEQTTLSTALMERARSVILPALKAVDPQATIYDALRVVGIDTPQTRSATPPQPGSVGSAVMLHNAERAAKGLPPMDSKETQAFVIDWETKEAAARQSFGQDRESISQTLFGVPFSAATQEQRAVVIDEEKKMLHGEAQARAEGTGQGRFNTPIDVKTAQDTGLPTGVTSAQVAGQNVPTLTQQEQLRELVGLRADLTRILGDGTEQNPGLIAVLPKNAELGGKAPGAAWAIKRRTTHREQAASLQSAVDSIVNVLARSRGQQRGAQTERDAERAYNAIVQLQAGLTDPFGGDTQESAAGRIKEALIGLDRVITGLPKQAVAQPVKLPTAGPATPAQRNSTPAAAPATPAQRNQGGSGLFMDGQGNIVDATGKVVVPGQ